MSTDQAQGSRMSGGLKLAPLAVGLVLIAIFAVSRCQEGPFGRKQVVALNPEQESSLGAQAYTEVLKDAQQVAGGPLVEAVRRVTSRLEAATNQADFLKATKLRKNNFSWEVTVVRSEQVNAFCLPGGKMVVYTGILPVCQTEAGLAVVMGHEIGHVLRTTGRSAWPRSKWCRWARRQQPVRSATCPINNGCACWDSSTPAPSSGCCCRTAAVTSPRRTRSACT